LVLQVECHAYLPQKELVEFCQKNGIVVTAYAPIGSPARFGGGHGGPVLLEEAMLKTIADRHHKTPAQILLNWLIQRKIGVLPKSVKPERLLENFNVLNFNLSKEDLADIEKIGEKNLRFLDFAG
jgi:diketogulonate reductase-like aldo/keto reductase